MVHDEACVQTEEAVSTTAQVEHILIVDDDVAQADVLAHRFAQQGFRTSMAHTGRAGLALARTERPDLILLDIRLPDSDGLNVCLELSDDPHTCSIPVIIVSGMERPDIIRQSRAAGCLYYVRKPFDPNALLILVQNAIAESRDW